jgi:uncharacterized membrane protein YphA (DoxX/SURF4 family)
MTLSISVGLLAGLARIVVGTILLVAGIAKVKDRDGRFLRTIVDIDLVPRPLASLLARLLPALEVAIGIALVTGMMPVTASVLGAGLLLVFAAVVGVTLARGKQAECGCFGGTERIRWRLVCRNLVLATLLAFAYSQAGGPLRVGSASGGGN